MSLILVGCGSAASTEPTTAPSTNLSIQLSWSYDYSASGFYAAVKNDHYTQQNLNVELVSGGYVNGHYVDPVEALTTKSNDFSESDAQSLLQARADGKSVVAVASVQQRSPNAIITLADKHILRPQDLVGKTIAINEGGAVQVFTAMLKLQGIDPSQVTVVARTDFGVDPLIHGDVDALVGWVTNEGVLVKEAGLDPSFMLFTDYGIPTYNILIITSEQMVKEHPDTIERFLLASFAGWQDVVDNPQQGAEYTLAYNKDLKLDEQLTRLQASIPLIQPSRSKIGEMDSNTWQQIYDVLVSAGTLDKPVDVTSAYTLQFVNKIYPQ
jgi:NitT/TauT family transport system substrate-binding protein